VKFVSQSAEKKHYWRHTLFFLTEHFSFGKEEIGQRKVAGYDSLTNSHDDISLQGLSKDSIP
jgi:hypothetical protein